MATLQGRLSVTITLLLLYVTLTEATARPSEEAPKWSFLREFIARRREIFPFTSDLEIQKQSLSLGSNVSSAAATSTSTNFDSSPQSFLNPHGSLSTHTPSNPHSPSSPQVSLNSASLLVLSVPNVRQTRHSGPSANASRVSGARSTYVDVGHSDASQQYYRSPNHLPFQSPSYSQLGSNNLQVKLIYSQPTKESQSSQQAHLQLNPLAHPSKSYSSPHQLEIQLPQSYSQPSHASHDTPYVYSELNSFANQLNHVGQAHNFHVQPNSYLDLPESASHAPQSYPHTKSNVNHRSAGSQASRVLKQPEDVSRKSSNSTETATTKSYPNSRAAHTSYENQASLPQSNSQSQPSPESLSHSGHLSHSVRNQPTPRKINDQSTGAQLQLHTHIYENDGTAVSEKQKLNKDALQHTINFSETISSSSTVPSQLDNTLTSIVGTQDGIVISPERILELLNKKHTNVTQTTILSNALLNKRLSPLPSEKPTKESLPENLSIFQSFLASLRRIPVIGNVLRATVDPIYRPILNSLLPTAENRQSTDEFQEEVNCFGTLGCLVTTIDFYDPIIRPINLPPDTRETINTHYTLYTRRHTAGVSFTPLNVVNRIRETTYNSKNPTKFILHGFLDDQNSTWIKDMTRGLLHHGNYNVFTVDWSDGSRVIYHQAVSNIRVVALELVALIKFLHTKLGQRLEDVHVIGHSLGSHLAGHIGERLPGLGRITGLDPAEPFFQYMPPSVRLDYTDASFVDVIHTDTDSIMTLAWQLAGFGLEQPVGHIDFYPNGGRQQPGCETLARIPLTALQDGEGLAEGFDAAEKEAVACNHIRANKLFTASLYDSCTFQAFPCQSYREFEKASCFSCAGEEGCASLGIDAGNWQPNGRKNVKMFLSTSRGPDFCQYHYRLTLTLGDERRQGGSLRGRLTVTLITQGGELREFDLTESSPLVFRRGTTRTFLLRHGEDFSSTRDSLVRWQFEADVFNPLTFCVLFCTAELEVAAVTLTPLDTPEVTRRHSNVFDPPYDIVMCHKQGQPVVRIQSEKTVKISAESFCPALKKRAEEGGGVTQGVVQGGGVLGSEGGGKITTIER